MSFTFDDGGPPAPIQVMAQRGSIFDLSDLMIDDSTSDSYEEEEEHKTKKEANGENTREKNLFDSTHSGEAPELDVAVTPDEEAAKGSLSPKKKKSVIFCEEIKQPRRKSSILKSERARERPKNGKSWPEQEKLSFTRSLVFYGHGAITVENEEACKRIGEARQLRKKYLHGKGVKESPLLSDNPDQKFEYTIGSNGIIEVYPESSSSSIDKPQSLISIPTIDEFVLDYKRLVEIASNGSVRSFSFQRLQMLTQAFKMHITANGHVEHEAQSNLLGTDFYRIMKVDNHIHSAAAPSAKQFVSFVREKLEKEGDTVVYEGKTLREVFTDAGLDTEHLTIDAFSVLADNSVYQRFDNFNNKYSPFRLAHMRKIFLKTENELHGRYFAEMLKTVLARHEASKGHNSAAEMRLSIYGMERVEWHNLAQWVMRDWGGDNPGPLLSKSNRWMIQVPRLWRIYCAKGKKGKARSFQDMIENIFRPMMDATLFPEKDPVLAEMLKHVVGFDSVDDEGASEEPCCRTRPSAWNKDKNPAYSWQLYYLWANIEIVNRIRKRKGLNTFAFRPHAGETGDAMHLATTYMLCVSINHGINLDKQVSLQYLYYLDQVGLSLSPLSNNFLFRKIGSNPFPKFFKRGMNVTLSTDDPLLFHMSDDALLEEYSVARASFDLSMTDIAEIARNSVLQCGFEEEFKVQWLGKHYSKGITLCDERKTHVPLIRSKFRAEHHAQEKALIKLFGANAGQQVLKQMMTQYSLARDEHRRVFLDHFAEEEEPFYL